MVSSKHKKTEESSIKRDRRKKVSHACESSSFTSSARKSLSSPENEHQPGDIVCITSVKGNAGYNGCKGIIMNAIFLNEEKQKENLSQNYHVPRYQVRLIEGYPDKILYVKSSNLIQEERDSRDWILKEKKMSLMEIIKSPAHSSRIGNAHACHDFALNLWAEVTRNRHHRTPRSSALVLHDKYESIGLKNMRRVILDARGHKIFWLGLDSICHHLILERCLNGRWRIFQSCIREGSLGYMSKGYTGKEWCSQDSFIKENPAHKRWGGGITVGTKQINCLLDIIFKFQELTAHILRTELLDQVPNVDSKLIKHLKAGPNSDIPSHYRNRIVQAAKKVREYGNDLLNHNAFVTGLGAGRGDPLPAVKHIRLDIGEGKYSLRISVDSYNRCQDLYGKLTGEKINPGNIFRMLQTGLWWEFLVNPDGSYNGFYFRTATLN